MRKVRFKSVKGMGKRRGSDRIKGTDTLYINEAFLVDFSLVLANGGALVRRSFRNRTKEYFALHVAKVLNRKYGGPVRFKHVQIIIDSLRSHESIAHWIQCFFDVLSNPEIAKYRPTIFAKNTNLNRFSNFRKAITKSSRDAEYTVRKYFAGYKKHKVDGGRQMGVVSEYDEIMDAVKYTGKVLIFYFATKMPLVISKELYEQLVKINPKIELYYNLNEKGLYRRNHRGRIAGSSLPALGEECAARLFIYCNQKKKRSGH